ncbi:MAG: SDR family oxidoreductase [Bradyrhizobium guangdongense]
MLSGRHRAVHPARFRCARLSGHANHQSGQLPAGRQLRHRRALHQHRPAQAARAGTIALMKSLAREWGRSGVTANSISLGLIETSHDKAWVDANREKLVKAYAIRRLGLPSDVAPLVTLLASDAGSWITGQVISVNGGYSMV